jgi:hypothetical protein
LYNGVALSGYRQTHYSRITVLDIFLATPSKSIQLIKAYIQYFMSLGDLKKPPEQIIVSMSQIVAPTSVGPRRYAEGASDQFSKIAVVMGDEP